MINKLKRKFKEIGKIYRLAQSNRQEVKIAQGFMILSSFKFNSSYLPFNSFSLNTNTIVDVLNDILLNQRKTIVEFGSGICTIYIAKLIKEHDLNVEFYSIDSDNTWQERLIGILRIEGLSNYVSFVKAEIKPLKNGNFPNQNKWYDSSKVLEIASKTKNPIDLVIVDGPYGQICDYIRYPALPTLKNYLSNKFCLILDDTNRIQESEIFRNWEEILNIKGEYHETYSKIIKGQSFKTHL